MSVLEEIYAAQRGRKSTEVVRLSRELRDELLAAVGLSVVTSMNMRLSPSGKVVASDASSAAVAAEVAPSVVLELQRLGLNQGLWNRLLNPYAAYLREKMSSKLMQNCLRRPMTCTQFGRSLQLASASSNTARQ